MSEYVCCLCSFGWKEAFPSSGRSLSTKNRAEAVSTLQTGPRGANLTTGWGYKGKMKAEEETMTSTATSNAIVHSYLPHLPSLSWRSFLTLTVGLVAEMRFWGQFYLQSMKLSCLCAPPNISNSCFLLICKTSCLLSIQTSFEWGWKRRIVPSMALQRRLGRLQACVWAEHCPITLGNRAHLILPCGVYFIGDQALLANRTQTSYRHLLRLDTP